MELLNRIPGITMPDEPFVALVSPSIRSMKRVNHLALNGFLKAEGAFSVHAVDSGIEEFVVRSAEEIADKGHGLHILSACPMSRKFIEGLFPALVARILATPSPMALRALSSLKEAGLEQSGIVLAITSCSYKKSEYNPRYPHLKIIELRDLLDVADEVNPFSFPELPYDSSYPETGTCHDIAALVAETLAKKGIQAKSVKLDGTAAAGKWLKSITAEKAAGKDGRTSVVELTFCKGGCS